MGEIGNFSVEELVLKLQENEEILTKSSKLPPEADPEQSEKKPQGGIVKRRVSLPQFPFDKHTKIWQKFVPLYERETHIQKFVSAFYCAKEGSRERRLAELHWFARRLEQFLFEVCGSREVYEDAVETIRHTHSRCMNENKELSEMLEKNIIPPTERLQRMFLVPAVLEQVVEDDYMAEGAATVHLIKDDRFKHHHLILKPDFNLPTLPGGYKNENEQRRKQMRRGPNNRKIALARYTNRPPLEDFVMRVPLTLCEQPPKDESTESTA